MTIVPEGIPIYAGKGILYDHLSMSNTGLIGSGRVDHLTATAVADTFRFYPDSMITQGYEFYNGCRCIASQVSGAEFGGQLTSNGLQSRDEWYAVNSRGTNDFSMFANGTTMAGAH
ncbi:MAG: hypothetical protein MZV63_13915 [Marinilabiliales bacterium]|nr:hypothetical protein [Marinilabiliales bacterium]